MLVFQLLHLSQHDAYVAALEERHRGDSKQEAHPQDVAIEGGGTVEIAHVDGDLADL